MKCRTAHWFRPMEDITEERIVEEHLLLSANKILCNERMPAP